MWNTTQHVSDSGSEEPSGEKLKVSFLVFKIMHLREKLRLKLHMLTLTYQKRAGPPVVVLRHASHPGPKARRVLFRVNFKELNILF